MTDFLQLRSLKTVAVEVSGEQYIVKAEGVGQLTHCPYCKIGRLHGHGMQEQSFQDTPSHGQSVVILLQRRRYRCSSCSKTLFEPVADLDGKRLATARLVRYVQSQCFTKTFVTIAKEVAVDEKTVRHIFDDYIEAIEAKVRFETPRMLGIDEVKVIGAYRAMITNVEHNTIFDIRPSRTKAELLPYFRNLRNKDAVEWITMDMYNSYRLIIREALPQARIVVDRFHIQRMGNNALEKVRKQIRKELSTRQRLKLKDDRFVLLSKQVDLDDDEIGLMLEWFRQYPLLGEAHALKEGFAAIWDQPSRADAELLYAKWRANIPAELTATFKELTTAMNNWHDEIFAYFEQRITNAYTESVNKLTKDMNRIGRGYSFEVLRARMLYDIKARKDGAKLEKMVVEDKSGPVSTEFFSKVTSDFGTTRKKVETRVVEYGPYIPTLMRLLEEGYFD